MTKEDEFDKLFNRNVKEQQEPEVFEGLMAAEVERLEQMNKKYIYQTLLPRLRKLLVARDKKLKAQILNNYANWLHSEYIKGELKSIADIPMTVDDYLKEQKQLSKESKDTAKDKETTEEYGWEDNIIVEGEKS